MSAADLHAIKRTQALGYAIDQLRRAASAVCAARWGEPNPARAAQLEDAHRQLESLLWELKALE